MKKLFVATIEVEMVVVADDEKEAGEVAANHLDEDIRNMMPSAADFTISKVDPKRPYVANWEHDSSPWGDEEGRTIASYLNDMKTAATESPKEPSPWAGKPTCPNCKDGRLIEDGERTYCDLVCGYETVKAQP